MSGPEGFLSRWSRRKRETAQSETARKPDQPRPEEFAPAKAADSGAHRDHAPAAPGTKPEAVFDISKLPPIESITSATDIRPFLASGVPAGLTRAALRRAWIADPAIRNFIGLCENSWDFNSPDVPGFDLSPPVGDLKRMVAEIFGEPPGSDSSAEARTGDAGISAGDAPAAAVSNATAESTAGSIPSHRIVNERIEPGFEKKSKAVANQSDVAEHKRDDIAPQDNDAAPNASTVCAKRSHGGALPH